MHSAGAFCLLDMSAFLQESKGKGGQSLSNWQMEFLDILASLVALCLFSSQAKILYCLDGRGVDSYLHSACCLENFV